MSKDEFNTLTEELKKMIDEFLGEVEVLSTFEHGYKAAGKRARALARELKNKKLGEWIKASVEVTR